MTVTLVANLPSATAAAVLRGTRRALARERPGDGCVVFASGVDVEGAARLASLLRGDCFAVRFIDLRWSTFEPLLATVLGLRVQGLLMSAKSRWGTVAIGSNRAPAGEAHQWQVDIRRDKRAEGSSAGFQRASAAVRELFAVGAGGAGDGDPSSPGAWLQSRNEAVAQPRAPMAELLRRLVQAQLFEAADDAELLLEVAAPFADLQHLLASQGDHPPGRVDVRGEHRGDYSNLDPEHLAEALSILDRGDRRNALVSFVGLSWIGLADTGGSLTDALDLVADGERWELRLRSSELLPAEDRALAVATARRVLGNLR